VKPLSKENTAGIQSGVPNAGKNHKTKPLVMLVVLVLIFVFTVWLGSLNFWLRLIKAGTEAGIIGGLVDWFAVVALFNHPLGIPIPHTAIIRNKTEEFAEGAYDFVIKNFSDPNKASQFVKEREPARHLSEWFKQPKNSDAAAKIVTTSIPLLLTPQSDSNIRTFLIKTIVEELRKQNISPVVGRLLEQVYRRKHHQEIVDILIGVAKKFLEQNPGVLRETVAERSSWWIPGFLDRRMADIVEASLLEKLDEISDPNHDFRRRIDTVVETLIEDLKHDRFDAYKIRDFWQRFIGSEQTGQLIGGMWTDIKKEMLDEDGTGTEKLKDKLASLFQALGAYLNEDVGLQEEIDNRLSKLVERTAPDVVELVATYIRDEIKGWSGDEIAAKMEAAVGNDLQYIRINGTVLGCVVGVLLFLAVEAVTLI